MADIDDTRALASKAHGLAVVSVPRDDGTVGATVVSAGVVPHPADGDPVVAFVSGVARRPSKN